MSQNTHEGIRNLFPVSSISLAFLFFYFIINTFYSSLNFFLAGRIPEDVRLSNQGFEEQISPGKIFLILFF